VVAGVVVGLFIGLSSARRTRRILRDMGSIVRTSRTLFVIAGVALGLALAHRFGVSLQFLAFCGLASMGLEHVVVDRATHRLARATTMRAGFFGFVLLSIDALSDARPGRIAVMVGCSLLAVLSLAALSAISRNGLGRGDVRLASVLVLHLGSIGAIVALRGVLLAFVVGGVVAAVMLLSRRATRSSTFAFGPYLVVAAFVVAFVPTLAR
jgi:leader peptidase (prepilin peptidase)/N-methyltransferase